MKKEILIFGIICLFIGIAVAPSVTSIDISKNNPSNNDDLVEITLQLCKTDGVEDHKMFITQEQDKQLDILIESFKTDLNNAENREETIEIYKDMIVSLDELGIIPEDLSCEETQQLVTGENRISNPVKMKSIKQFKLAFEKLKNKNSGLDEGENMFCQISGETDETEIIPFPSSICILFLLIRAVPLTLLWVILENLYFHLGLKPIFIRLFGEFFILRYWFWIEISKYINFSRNIGGLINFGYSEMDSFSGEIYYYPAKGWISTNGLNGKKYWFGTFLGYIFNMPTDELIHYVGVLGFTGIKINNFYQGTALKVKIDKI